MSMHNFSTILLTSKKLTDVASIVEGTTTGNVNRFLKLWYEVNYSSIGFDMKSALAANNSHKKWFPYLKGSEYRKWYGNNDVIINWQNNGQSVKEYCCSFVRGEEFYFNSGVTWSKVTSKTLSFRYFNSGFCFDAGGLYLFGKNGYNSNDLLMLLNSKLSQTMLELLAPTLNFTANIISTLPIINSARSTRIFSRIIKITKNDWDTYETSWDFQSNPLLMVNLGGENVIKQTDIAAVELHARVAKPLYALSTIYADWEAHNQKIILALQQLEQENNRLFINAYGLQDELTSDVPLEQITLIVNPKYRYSKKLSEEDLSKHFQSDTLTELISYAIGCIMGRYRFDKPGLIYAHASNVDFNRIYNIVDGELSTARQINQPLTFSPNDDGIIPLTDDKEWFKDDATNRFRDFIQIIFGEENLQQNLDFVADSLCLHALKPKNSENNLSTIRRYLSTQFYKNHLKTYKKRPIYWLFSSGKQKGFECLVYMHRYNESTLSRISTKYVTPLLGKYDAFAIHLKQQLREANIREATQLKKDLAILETKQTELCAFNAKLKKYADQLIKIDLDDGVKLNYGKFGDLLVNVEVVTGIKK